MTLKLFTVFCSLHSFDLSRPNDPYAQLVETMIQPTYMGEQPTLHSLHDPKKCIRNVGKLPH